MNELRPVFSMETAPLPVTLITGFLGAGKSTYINKILRANSGRRIGLVVNEFGEVGLESNIIEASPQDIVELSGGCMCCVLRKDLKDAVQRLIRHDSRLERIVVEASGLSDPQPVQETFRNAGFANKLQLESVICMVDQQNFLDHRTKYGVVDRQVRASDFVLLTKGEQAGTGAVEQILQDIAPGTPRYTVGSEPPLGLLIGSARGHLESHAGQHGHHQHGDGQEERSHVHDGEGHHEHDVQQLWFESEHPFDPERLKGFFHHLPTGVVRGKGVLYLENKDGRKHKFLLQLSGARRELSAVRWKRGENKANVVLLLGKGFDPDLLRHELGACLVRPFEVLEPNS